MKKQIPLTIIGTLIATLSASAQDSQFQRIRTFDPTTGRISNPVESAPLRYAPVNTPASATDDTPSAPKAPSRKSATTSTTTSLTQTSQFAPTPQTDDSLQPQDESNANMLAPMSQPAIMPPDTLSRPALPQANENVVLPSLNNPNVRPSLSWRSKAYKLSLESFDNQNNAKHPNFVMNGSVEDSINALVQACQTNGLQIIGQSVPAGQLGARLNDVAAGRSLFIFALKRVADDKTIVKGSVEPDSKGRKLILLGDLLNQAASLVDGKGLL